MTNAKPNKKIAIITGASSGLGTEFALQIEKNLYVDEIWLIARRTEPMKDLAEKFQKSRGVTLALDLTNQGDLLFLEGKLKDEMPTIVCLVNNAGFGKIGPFADLGREEQMRMVNLNISALTFLTHICIPFMKAGSKIVQVASSAGFCASPYFAVYAATKAYVVSLSEALHYELKDRGIHVMAVCPGPVATEFFSVAQKNEYMKDKVGEAEPFNKFLMASAHQVVERALLDLGRNRKFSIFGFPIKLFLFALPFLPRNLVMYALSQRKAR